MERDNEKLAASLELQSHKNGIRYMLYFMVVWIVALIIGMAIGSIVHAQTLNDGIPEPDRANPEYRLLTFRNDAGNFDFEYLPVPTLIRDFGKVGFIDVSPSDPNRNFDNLPTYTLARWHWWLFGFEVLPRVQRQFGEVIAEIKTYQKLCGDTVMIDDPRSPVYTEIISVRDYLVPFEPVTTTNKEHPYAFLATKQEQIEHLKAAVFSVNLTVFYRGLYEGYAETKKQEAIQCVFKRSEETICKELKVKLKSTKLKDKNISVCKGYF